MRNVKSRSIGYILTAIGGAALGGLFVAIFTRVLSRATVKMREMMSE